MMWVELHSPNWCRYGEREITFRLQSRKYNKGEIKISYQTSNINKCKNRILNIFFVIEFWNNFLCSIFKSRTSIISIPSFEIQLYVFSFQNKWWKIVLCKWWYAFILKMKFFEGNKFCIYFRYLHFRIL